MIAALSRGEGARREIGALQIVQPAAGDELVVRAPDGRRHAIIEEEIASGHILDARAGGFGNQRPEAALGRCAAIERHGVHGEIVLIAVVDSAVHVNGDVGNEHEIARDIDQPRLNALIRFDQHASRNRQRPVEPCIDDQPAVMLHIELDVMAGLQLGVLFDAEGRAVAVRGADLHGRKAPLRHGKRDDARAVARDDVLLARLDAPFLALIQANAARRFEQGAQLLRRVERRGRFFHKGQKIVYHMQKHPPRDD